MTNTGRAKVDGRTTRHVHRRSELLKAVTDYVLDNGVAALSLRPTADALGVTHSTLLRQFGSKDLLIAEVVEGICVELVGRATDQVVDLNMSTEQTLRSNWQQFCEPSHQRQFLVLFELVALNARQPDRFGSLAELLVEGMLAPIEENLRLNGRNPEEARQLATVILAQVRGLHLDLAITGDQRRVDQAWNRFVDMITASQ